MRVLFVCDDNVRASPMAAGFLYHEHRQRRIEPFVVASAGFGPAGRPIDASVVTLLDDRGVDLSRKRTRELSADMVDRADLIATMTGSQANRLTTRWPEVARRVFALRHLCAVVASRPAGMRAAAMSPAMFVRELQATVQRSYSIDGDPAFDIAEPAGTEFGATLNLADQLLAATTHLADCLWPNDQASSATASSAASTFSRLT